MSENNEIVKRTLPTLNDLVSEERSEELLKLDKLNYLLNRDTPKQWVKEHPLIKIKVAEGKYEPLQYVPVERTLLTLTQIFGGFTPKITGVYQMFNSVVVTCTIEVINPVTGEKMTVDGIGAVGIQTDKGTSASDMGAIKQDAVMKAAPAAYSYAKKNAAENLGSIFGSKLQKYDLAAFTPFYNTELKEQLSKQLTEKFTNGSNA